MAEQREVKVQGRGGRGRAMGPRPKIENPGKILKRILGYVMQNYGIHFVIVVICILGSVLANVQ